MLDAYLNGLERRLATVLSPEEAQAYRTEIEGHLLAEIESRIELGDAPEAAEREAIAAFGAPKRLLKAAKALHRSRFQRLFLGLATAGGLGWAFALLASPVLPREAVVGAGVAFFAMLAGFVSASEVRRPWRPVLQACAIFWLAFAAICAAWIRDYSFEGWLAPRFKGPPDLIHAAQWSAVATLVFLGYLALAYRMARPLPTKRGQRE